MLEKQIENKLTRSVKKAGGIALKFVSPSFPNSATIRTFIYTQVIFNILYKNKYINNNRGCSKNSNFATAILHPLFDI